MLCSISSFKAICAIFVTFIVAQHNGECEDSNQCQHGKCQYKAKLNDGGASYVQNPGMYVSSKAFIEMMVMLNWLTIPEFALR